MRPSGVTFPMQDSGGVPSDIGTTLPSTSCRTAAMCLRVVHNSFTDLSDISIIGNASGGVKVLCNKGVGLNVSRH